MTFKEYYRITSGIDGFDRFNEYARRIIADMQAMKRKIYVNEQRYTE